MDFLRNNRILLHLTVGIVLSLIYPMQELFSGNQNVYFLWGMAELLPNAFSADPLLNSPDPYPFFSWLISLFPVQFIGIWTTALYVLLHAIYSFTLFGIANEVADIYRHKSRLFSFLAFFLFLHCNPIWGTYFHLIADVDLRWVWDSGIAEQGVLRGYLQPSVFGVFLLLSFYFATQRNFAAAILTIAPAAMIHANYLFLGAILALIYLFYARFDRKSVFTSILLLVAVLPYSYYLYDHFISLSTELKSALDQAVMAGYESNIHINPINWLNVKFNLQLAVLALASITIWKTRFRSLFFTILITSAALTTIAYLTNHTTLISLNPWRLSVLLVPVGVTVLASKLVSSGVWDLLRPILFSLFGSICIMLIYHRIFGTSSSEFFGQWLLIHLVVSATFVIISMWLSKQEWFSHKLELLLVAALIVTGSVEMLIEQQSKSIQEQFQAIEQLEGVEQNTVYIVPPNWTSIRLNASKSVFVDENLVYGPSLPGIVDRQQIVSKAYETGNFGDVLVQIPEEIAVKLIAPNQTQVNTVISQIPISKTHSCYLLRE